MTLYIILIRVKNEKIDLDFNTDLYFLGILFLKRVPSKTLPFVECYTNSSIITIHSFFEHKNNHYYIIDDKSLVRYDNLTKNSDIEEYDYPISFFFDNNNLYLNPKNQYGNYIESAQDKDNKAFYKNVFEDYPLFEEAIDYYYSSKQTKHLSTRNEMFASYNMLGNDEYLVGLYNKLGPLIKKVGYDELYYKNYYVKVEGDFISVSNVNNETEQKKITMDRLPTNTKSIDFNLISIDDNNLYFINRNGKAIYDNFSIMSPLYYKDGFKCDTFYVYDISNDEINLIHSFNNEMIIRATQDTIYTLTNKNVLYKYDVKDFNNKEIILTIPSDFNCIENCKEIIVFYNYEKLDDNEYCHYLVTVFDTTTDKEIDLYNNNEE